MKRNVGVALVVLVAAAVSALSTAFGETRPSSLHIGVKPSIGYPATRFVLSFRAPDRTGRYGAGERRYHLTATGALGDAACVVKLDKSLPFSRRHDHVRVTLDPARLGGLWCPGQFRGSLEEIQRPVCPKGSLCPEFAVRISTIGRFTFAVQTTHGVPGPPGADTVPPTFAGLQRAFACTPGPQKPGQTTSFTLTWTAATDDVTASWQIVYDVYISTSRSGEDFAHPTWTSVAGATTYKTPGLPSHGTFYFIVRARDRAGNEDRNTVEVRGIDPCV